MTKRKPEQPQAPSSLYEGLVSFYSSEADVVMAKYLAIDHLLGKTRHRVHSGSLCEALIRDVLRRNVLQWMSVDKGYVYGRTNRLYDGKEDHSPEIDILIHDTQNYRPMFRMGDFVIVEPPAARGLIQIKKKLTGTAIFEGIKNVAEAKRHTLQMLNQSRNIFSAVIGLAKGSKKSEVNAIKTNLKKYGTLYRAFVPDRPSPAEPIPFLMPQFVGSIEGCYAVAANSLGGVPIDKAPMKLTYLIFDSHYKRKNFFLQHLLVSLAHTIFPMMGRPLMAPPHGRELLDRVELDFGLFRSKT